MASLRAVAGLACGGQQLLGVLTGTARWLAAAAALAPRRLRRLSLPLRRPETGSVPASGIACACGHRDLIWSRSSRLSLSSVQTRIRSVCLSPHCSADLPLGSEKSRFPLGSRRPSQELAHAAPEALPGSNRGRRGRTEAVFDRDLRRGRRCRCVPSTGSCGRGQPGSQRTRRLPSEIGSGRTPSSKAKSRQSGRFIGRGDL